MRVLQALMWVSASVVVPGLLGCGGSDGGHSHRETVYVERQQPEYVIVREAPPPVVEEQRPSPPSHGHIWIDGYWHWDGHKYVWEHGHWAVPPHEHAVWVAPRYERHEQGYRYTPGQWREEGKDRDREREQGREREREGDREQQRDKH